MLSDETKKQKGKKAPSQSGENPAFFTAAPDPDIVRLLTPREQWTPAQKRVDKRAEEATRARGAIWYEQLLGLLRTGDLAGAERALNSFPGGLSYFHQAVEAVARAQVRAGELLAAVATAQRLRYGNTKGDVLGAVIQVLLDRGDVVKAEWLAATVTGFGYVGVMKLVASARQQAGNAEAARHALVLAQAYAERFDVGDMKNGYFRSYYLADVAAAQLRLGDVAGATHTAQLIDRPDDQERVFQLIGKSAAGVDDTSHRDHAPA